MRLAPGRVLVKPVETAETLNGGRILLTEATREHWTMGQAEVIQVGPPQECDDEDCERFHQRHFLIEPASVRAPLFHPVDERLVPGAWVLCKPRKFVEVPEGYLVMQDDIIAIMGTTVPSEQTPI